MPTYRFSYLNGGLDIVDPEIIIDPIVNDVNPLTMTISANIELRTQTCRFAVLLDNIRVMNLNYDADTLILRVSDRLRDFEV